MEGPVRWRLPAPRSDPHGALPLRALLGDRKLPALRAASWLGFAQPRWSFRADWVGSAAQVRGDLPPQKSRVALDSVVFVEEARREEELGSVLADIIAHLGQDVSMRNSCCCRLVFSGFTGLVGSVVHV